MCVAGVCAGSRGLLKLSQLVGLGKLASVGSGVGGYVLGRITVSEAMAILDNSYRKCYNKRSDNNKNVICHQTGKNALVKRFCH